MKNILTTAVPLGISWILTYGEVSGAFPCSHLPQAKMFILQTMILSCVKWEVMTLFASHMGPAEVAAWGILGFVWDTFEYIIGKSIFDISCILSW